VRAAVRRASGPRELRSLRTQQRAYGRRIFRPPVPTSGEAVLDVASMFRPNWSAFHP